MIESPMISCTNDGLSNSSPRPSWRHNFLAGPGEFLQILALLLLVECVCCPLNMCICCQVEWGSMVLLWGGNKENHAVTPILLVLLCIMAMIIASCCLFAVLWPEWMIVSYCALRWLFHLLLLFNYSSFSCCCCYCCCCCFWRCNC